MCSVVETAEQQLSETFSSLFAFFLLLFMQRCILTLGSPFRIKDSNMSVFVITNVFFALCFFFVTFALVPLLSDIGVLPFTPKDEHDLISGILSLLAPTINLTCTLQLMVSETRQGNLIAASSPSPGKCLDTLPTKLSSFTKLLMN